MYKDVDELMIMGPVWDMDWSSGAAGTSAGSMNQWATNYFNSNAQRYQWYKDLVKDPYFLMNAQERYWEIRNLQVQDMMDSIDVHMEYLAESGVADGERWPGRRTFQDDAGSLQYWLNTHLEWMDTQMATEDSLVASFPSFTVSNALALSVTNSVEDLDEVTPADALVGTADDVVLNIDAAGMSGNAQIYLNGKLTDTVTLNNAKAEYTIAASALTAEADTKNVIEVKVTDNRGTVTARNYITVKQSDCIHADAQWNSNEEYHWKECECGNTAYQGKHTFEWHVDKEATETENGIRHEECTVCEYKRNENSEYEYVEIPADPSDSSRDIPVDRMVAISDSEHPNEPDDKILDGNVGTHWHTNYGAVAEGLDASKRWVGVSLNEAEKVSGIRFYPRQDHGNGFVTEYEIQYRETDDGEWISVASGTWSDDDLGWKYVGFSTVTAKQVRIVGVHTYASSGSDRHMSCAEFRLVAPKNTTVTTPDKTTLNLLIGTADKLNTDDYVDFTAVAEALNNAKNVAANEEATQDEIDAAVTALRSAINALTKLAPSDVIPVSEMTASAGDYEPGDDPKNAIDENEKTLWHTNWKSGPNHDNHWLQLDLKNPLFYLQGYKNFQKTFDFLLEKDLFYFFLRNILDKDNKYILQYKNHKSECYNTKELFLILQDFHLQF